MDESTYFACLGGYLFVCLKSINVKTAEITGLQFFVGLRRKVLGLIEFEKWPLKIDLGATIKI